jgi:hypothetical protein
MKDIPHIFQLNQHLTAIEIQDALNERLRQLRSIVGCMLSNREDDEYMPCEVFEGVMDTIYDYLEDIEHLQCRLEEQTRPVTIES